MISNGYVGIGTTTPTTQLDVNGATKINGQLKLYSDLIFENYANLKGDIMLRGTNSSTFFKLTTNFTSDPALYPIPGNVGYIGDLSHQFEYVCSYNICQNGNYVSSDKRKKENLRKIESPLEKLKKVEGWIYDFKSEAFDTIKNEKRRERFLERSKNRIGFMAQDLELIFPEAVLYEKEVDEYYINYDAIVPVLVEALKEQQAQIDALKASGSTIKSSSITSNIAQNLTQNCVLAQNIPNPFNSETRIDISLPVEINTAGLYIYNMYGKQIKHYPIPERGNTSITIKGYELEAGMYLYTLIADGQEVDTKKMILTE